MKVERAGPEEVDEVIAVLSEAAARLRSRGIEQWPHPFPVGWVEPSNERGETYLVRADGAVAGTITLRWEDPAFGDEQQPVAGYVHGVAVRREFAGLGAKLLGRAEEQAKGGSRAAAAGLPYRQRALAPALRGAWVRPPRRHGRRRPADEPLRAAVPPVNTRAGCGGIVALPARLGDRHARAQGLGSQRERGWPTTTPPKEGGGMGS